MWRDGDSEAERYATSVDVVEKKHRTLGQRLATLQKLNPFSKLDNDVQLVIGLIAAAADQIAVLGSAAGSGLTALGGALASVAAGGYATGAILVHLFQDIDKAPASMRPVLQQFSAFKDAFGEFNDAIAQAGFDRMNGTFDRFSNTCLLYTSPSPRDRG